MTFCVWTVKMDGTDKAGYDALKELFPRFTNSQVDPAWLAEELLSKDIIGMNIVQYANNQYHEKADRLRKVLFSVMGSGRRGVFQDLVKILSKTEHSWLGEELIGAYSRLGGTGTGGAANSRNSMPENAIRLSRSGRPSMVKLEAFPGPDGLLSIPEQIGVHYRKFGLLLLNDDTGAVVLGLERACFYNPAEINRAILQRWLERQHTELTWSRLVQCLKDIGFNTLASDIDSCLVD